MSEATTNAEALIKKLISLSTEGNLDEAIICGRSATRIEPDNPNAWWQLGHVLVKKHELSSARECFKKTTELAPSFTEGWCELGSLYQKTGELGEAIEHYEIGLLNDDEHVRTLKLLAPALKSRGLNGDDERRLEVLTKLHEIGELGDSEHFDFAYSLTQNKEYHKAQRVYEKLYLSNPNPAIANNLGVTYDRQGRHLDALDCYRIAARGEPSTELYQKNLMQTLDKLRPREKSVLSNPHLLAPCDRYRNYINPYVLMGFENDIDTTDIKALQKQKKALYQEIKLEDGKISWLNNHVVDSSAAMDICEKLNDEEYAAVQYAIYENASLCDFLMTGDLHYFLSEERPNEGHFPLQFQLPSEFLDAVSALFAAQFDMVLCTALEKKNLAAAQCLLGGRRLIKDGDADVCFAGARRLIERMLEPMKVLADKAESSKVDVSAAMAACSRDSINTLLSILPSEFIELQREYYRYLLTLSKEVYRDGGEIEEALKIIDLAAPIAQVCVDVNDSLTDAKRQLNELLAKEKEKEIHLAFGNKKLDITRKGVEYGGIRIGEKEVRALRWGIVFVSNSPRTAEFSFGISNLNGREILLSWRSSDIEPQRKHWEKILDGVFEYLFDSAYESFKASMNTAGQITLGGVDMNSRGATFTYDGWFSKKSHFAPWAQIRHEIDNGDLVLQDKAEKKATARISLESNWNAVLLKYYLSHMKG